MADLPVFDTLSARLSGDERRSLLERIRATANLSAEPLFPADSYPLRPSATPASRLAELGTLARFVLFFRRLFTGKTSEELLIFDEITEIARGVEARHPGLIDHRHGLLLEGLAAQFRILRDGARFFTDVLARTVEKDKGAFLALLASIDLPDIHARLMEETDPFVRAAPGASHAEVRSLVLDSWEDILHSLTDEKRRVMYNDLRGLLFLRRLSSYLFDRLLALFRPVPEGGPAASYREAHDLLLELGDLLFSLATPPSTELLEALFVGAARDTLGDPDHDAAAEISAEIAMGAEALQHIRSFNSRVPLGAILRLVADDPDYVPQDLPGGEDWFLVFKTYWKGRIEARLDEYKAESHFRELALEITQFVGLPEPVSFAHLAREGVEGSPPLRYELALVFLEGFYRGPFQRDLNRPLKLLLVDGEFYRKDNRIEFTDAYNTILQLHEDLAALDTRLSPEGDIGSAWKQAGNEALSLPFKRRKLDSIRRGAEDEAEKLIREAAEAFKCLARVVKGILKGEAGGRYDSLQNLAFIDGRANREFIRSLEALRGCFEKALSLLSELSDLDLGRLD